MLFAFLKSGKMTDSLRRDYHMKRSQAENGVDILGGTVADGDGVLIAG